MRLTILPLIAAILVLTCAPETRAADCTGPAGPEAQMLYNKDYHVLQYCDGTNWVGIGLASLDSGLVGWWKLDDGSGTTAADSSGGGHAGTLTNGPTWTTGQINGAVSFDGVNDYISLPSAPVYSPTQPYSVSLWVNPSNTSEGCFYMEGGGAGGSERFIIEAFNQGGPVRIWLPVDASPQTLAANTNLQTNAWSHIVWVDNAGAGKLYVNGVADSANFNYTPGAAHSTTLMQIGACNDGYASYAFTSGPIDDVRTYNRALSADEAAGSGSCTSPTGAEGTLLYNEAWRTVQYCNGSGWQRFERVYTAWGVTFDGSNDYLTRGADLSTSADAKTFTSSFWFRRNGGNGSTQVFYWGIRFRRDSWNMTAVTQKCTACPSLAAVA